MTRLALAVIAALALAAPASAQVVALQGSWVIEEQHAWEPAR